MLTPGPASAEGRDRRQLLRDGGELGHTVDSSTTASLARERAPGAAPRRHSSAGTAAREACREAFGPAVDAHRSSSRREGDSTAIEILDGSARMLGAAIGASSGTLSPPARRQRRCLLGQADSCSTGPRAMRREALAPAGDRVEIVRAELGTAAGVIGAALVAYDEFRLLERSVSDAGRVSGSRAPSQRPHSLRATAGSLAKRGWTLGAA